MIILHAGLRHDSFVLWAETNSIKPKINFNDSVYPLSANASQLRKVLNTVGINALSIDETDIFLPTCDNIPIPSNELLMELLPTPKLSKKLQFKQWLVNVATFIPHDVISLLGRLFGKRVLSHGVIVGADLAYMAEVMRLSASLVARQQYLPDVRVNLDDYIAGWNPVITGTDSEIFEDLVKRIPLSVLAFSYAENKIPNELPSEMLRRLITIFLESMIRVVDTPKSHKKFNSTHDSWIYGLRSSIPNNISGGDPQHLLQQIQEWQRPVKITRDMPSRLCFRLEEPVNTNDKWLVRYILQSREDPSLLVTAEEAWNSKSDTLSIGMVSREFIMLSLGYASEIFPFIASSKISSGITGCYIDAAEAYDFLTIYAAALIQAGYGVIFPSWWTGNRTRAKIHARANVKPPMKGRGMLNLDTIVRFDWELSLGDNKITLNELEALAEAKVPLVQMRGQWVEVSTEEIGNAIKFLKKKSKKASLLETIMMGIGGVMHTKESNTVQAIDVEIASENDHISQIFDGINDNTRLEKKAQPDGFEGTLRPYQIEGFSWMWFLQGLGLGGCLADDMGLGKTIQVLALVEEYRTSDKGPFLLVCPTSVISNWYKETTRFTPNLSIVIHHGTKRSKNISDLKKYTKNCNLVVTSYGLIHRDLDMLKNIKWAGIILDEAQNIKTFHTKQAKAARIIKANRRFALTGTPVENNVGDLWSIMEFLNPGLLGNEASFRRNFFNPIQMKQDEYTIEKLKRVTKPFILRRLKTDKSIISDLPEKIETKNYCQLTKEQTSLYKAVLKDIVTSLESTDGFARKGLILNSLLRLKQVCDHPEILLKDNSGIKTSGKKQTVRSGKLVRVTEMLYEVIESNESALVFTQFVEMGHLLRRHIGEALGCDVLFLHGGVPRKKRDELIDKFQNEETGPKVFVISLKAGGTGLNLTAANHVFHYDRWWNPAVENQATDRAFRIGQKKNVQVHKMICSGTLEEKIDDMLEQKTSISEKVVGAGETSITEMSNDEIYRIFSLGANTVMEDM